MQGHGGLERQEKLPLGLERLEKMPVAYFQRKAGGSPGHVFSVKVGSKRSEKLPLGCFSM